MPRSMRFSAFQKETPDAALNTAPCLSGRFSGFGPVHDASSGLASFGDGQPWGGQVKGGVSAC